MFEQNLIELCAVKLIEVCLEEFEACKLSKPHKIENNKDNKIAYYIDLWASQYKWIRNEKEKDVETEKVVMCVLRGA